MSYGKMCTRVGSIDFDIKLKIHMKKLMPGFVPFQVQSQRLDKGVAAKPPLQNFHNLPLT